MADKYTEPNRVQRVCILGAGTIGASWAAYFLARGIDVAIYDPSPLRESAVAEYLANAWPAIQRLSGTRRACPKEWTFSTDLEVAVRDMQFIQESAPEELHLKRALFAKLDGLVAADVIIASSTSSLVMSKLQSELHTASRFVVAHPFNPPHLMPLVEVVGGSLTDATVCGWCRQFFELHGKEVLVLRKEVPGHLVNRLQAALFQEAVWLVREGVASTSDVDRGIAFGPALRWALMGTFLTFHLGAETGIAGYLESLGGAHLQMWQDLGRVDAWTPELVRSIANQMSAETRDRRSPDLTRQRDEALVALLNFLAKPRHRLISE